jgi:hypothetical protein
MVILGPEGIQSKKATKMKNSSQNNFARVGEEII